MTFDHENPFDVLKLGILDTCPEGCSVTYLHVQQQPDYDDDATTRTLSDCLPIHPPPTEAFNRGCILRPTSPRSVIRVQSPWESERMLVPLTLGLLEEHRLLYRCAPVQIWQIPNCEHVGVLSISRRANWCDKPVTFAIMNCLWWSYVGSFTRLHTCSDDFHGLPDQVENLRFQLPFVFIGDYCILSTVYDYSLIHWWKFWQLSTSNHLQPLNCTNHSVVGWRIGVGI